MAVTSTGTKPAGATPAGPPAATPAATEQNPPAPADEVQPVESDCVVKSDFHVGRAVNGKVCSYHAMHYDAAGKRRK